MRIYGCIQTKFWTHPNIHKLSDQAKLLASYLFSSVHTTMLGCFRIPIGYIAEDLNWSFEKVSSALAELTEIDLLSYDTARSWVMINQFLKYHPIENPNQGKSVVKIFEEIPRDLTFINALINKLLENDEHLNEGFVKGLQTVSKPFRNQDQYQEQKQELMMSGKPDASHAKIFFDGNKKTTSFKLKREELKSQALEVLEFLNEKTGRAYRVIDTNLNLIMSRLHSGVTVGQCFQVIAKKYRDWNENPEMEIYLRPETLFSKKKFESYLGEVSVTDANGSGAK